MGLWGSGPPGPGLGYVTRQGGNGVYRWEEGISDKRNKCQIYEMTLQTILSQLFIVCYLMAHEIYSCREDSAGTETLI